MLHITNSTCRKVNAWFCNLHLSVTAGVTAGVTAVVGEPRLWTLGFIIFHTRPVLIANHHFVISLRLSSFQLRRHQFMSNYVCRGTMEPLRAAKLRPTNRSWIGFITVYHLSDPWIRCHTRIRVQRNRALVTCRRGLGAPGPHSWTPPLCGSRHVGEETPRCQVVW